MRIVIAVTGLMLVQTALLPSVQAASPSPSPSATAAQTLPADLYLGGSFPAVTPSQARRIVTAWWPLHESGLVRNDIALTDALEAGPAREYDDAVSHDNLVRGGNLRVVRPDADLQVLVPWTPQLPASFLAEVKTTVYGTTSDFPPDTPYTEILVFSRQNQRSPWTVMLRTGPHECELRRHHSVPTGRRGLRQRCADPRLGLAERCARPSRGLLDLLLPARATAHHALRPGLLDHATLPDAAVEPFGRAERRSPDRRQLLRRPLA